MRKIIITCTDEQFWIIFPTLQGACVDFAVTSSSKFDANAGRNTESIVITSDVAEAFRALHSSPDDLKQKIEKLPSPKPKLGKRKMQKRDHRGRTPLQVVLDSFDERKRTVATWGQIKHELTLMGFGAGTASGAIRKGVNEGKLRKLNGGRISRVGANYPLKEMKDLEIAK